MYDKRAVCLGEEVLVAVRLIERGLGEVARIAEAKDFHVSAMMLLSAGFERLMKCVLCYHELHVTGQLPTTKQIKGYGHDLDRLLEDVQTRCFDAVYVSSRGWAAEDDAFLRSLRLRSTMSALSRFARSSRYYNLTVVGGDEPDTYSPQIEWGQLESAILAERPDLLSLLAKPALSEPVFAELARILTIRLERAVRALARLFVFGPLGPQANQWSTYVSRFLRLDDDRLGTTDYRLRV